MISYIGHPPVTANYARHCLQNQREHNEFLQAYEAVHSTVVLDYDSSSGMLVILMKVKKWI